MPKYSSRQDRKRPHAFDLPNFRMRAKSPHQILIVNVHSSLNAGDLALLEQTISYLKEAFGVVNIKILANWPEEEALMAFGATVQASPARLVGVYNPHIKPRFQMLRFLWGLVYLCLYPLKRFSFIQKIIPPHWFNLYQAYEKSDFVVAVAGNQFFSSGRYGWPLPVIGYSVFIAEFLKTPVMVFPQSIGPFRREWERSMVKFLYQRAGKVFLRDSGSVHLASRMGIRKSHPEYMPDIAFTYPARTPEDALAILEPYGFASSQKKIGMTIISKMPSYLSPQKMETYYQGIADACQELIRSYGFRIYFFCQVRGPSADENDAIAVQHVMRLIDDATMDHIVWVDAPLSPAELKACYGQMDLFLATRLHSGIFSFAMNVPTLFVGYLDKTRGVLEALHMEDYFVDLAETSTDTIVPKLIWMWQDKEELRERIAENNRKIEAELARFSDIVAREFRQEENENR